MEAIRARGILTAIMLVSLMGTAGIALPYPVLSPFFLSGESHPLLSFMSLDAKLLFGITIATYPLGLLFGSNIIGSLSDRYGRKPVLIYSLLGSVIGYGFTALAVTQGSFLFFIIARFVTGFCEGNISIARAIATELHPHIDRGRALSLLYATVYGGWLLGPLAGGYLAPYGMDFTFYMAGLAVFASLLLVAFIIPKEPPQKPATSSFWAEVRHNHSTSLLKHKVIRDFFVYYFIYTLGINAFYEFYPLWLVEAHQFSSQQIGWMTVGITSLMILVSATIAEKVPRKIGAKQALLGGNILFASLIVLATLTQGNLMYLFLATTGAVIAVINMVFPAMLSEYFGHHGEGKVMGLQVSVFCFTNVVIAIGGSFVSLISAETTMWMAAVLIVISVFTFVQPQKQEDNIEFNSKEESNLA